MKVRTFFSNERPKPLRQKTEKNFTVRKCLYSLRGFDVGVLIKVGDSSIVVAITSHRRQSHTCCWNESEFGSWPNFDPIFPSAIDCSF